MNNILTTIRNIFSPTVVDWEKLVFAYDLGSENPYSKKVVIKKENDLWVAQMGEHYLGKNSCFYPQILCKEVPGMVQYTTKEEVYKQLEQHFEECYNWTTHSLFADRASCIHAMTL